MLIKLKELVDARNSFAKILTADIPFKLAYRCNKITKKIQDEVEQFDKQRNELIKKIGTKDEKTDTYTIPKEKMGDYTKQVDEVLQTELEFGADLIPQEVLEQVKLSMLDVSAISKFIEEPKA